MKEKEKQVVYSSSNSYLTLNSLTSDTRTIWMVFHGIGYLSRYFISYFKDLDQKTNYIIAPQAPSKYYLDNQYKHVGASWLTRENTTLEIDNVLNYIDAVYKAEGIPRGKNLVVFGFSQGVSVALRWLARYKIPCSHLVLYAGGIPKELSAGDFDFLGSEARISLYIGSDDAYLSPARMKDEREKLAVIFRGKAQIVTFKGGHEIKKELLKEMEP